LGAQGTCGLELPTPNPGNKRFPKACPTHKPLPQAPACHNHPQPKHPSHRAKSSVEIRKIITINNYNNNKNKEEGGTKH